MAGRVVTRSPAENYHLEGPDAVLHQPGVELLEVVLLHMFVVVVGIFDLDIQPFGDAAADLDIEQLEELVVLEHEIEIRMVDILEVYSPNQPYWWT